jgi:hypothetical protein
MNDFPDCFDRSAVVPMGYMVKVQEEFRSEMDNLVAALVKNKVSKKMMQAILWSYQRIIEGYRDGWSYEKVNWLRRFVKTLTESPVTPRRDTPLKRGTASRSAFYSPLLQQLIYYDFNSAKFKNWLMDAIHEDVDAQDSVYEKLERLAYHYKELSKMQVKEGSSYTSIAASVKEDLCTNVKTEMEHLSGNHLPLVSPKRFDDEKAQVKNLRHRETNSDHVQTDSNEIEGIFFGLSVEELALLIVMMKERGMIRNEKLNKLAAFLSKYCRTIGKENFGEQYLVNSFSNKNLKAIESLYSKLMDIVNDLAKMKRNGK